MLITRHGFRMFHDYDLYGTLDNSLKTLKKEIESDPDIVNEAEDAYVKKQVEKRTWKPLSLDVENISVETKDAEIPAEYFPNSRFNVERGQSYTKPVLTFRMPFTGNPELLKFKPSTMLMWSDEVDISGDEIIFEIINFSDDADSIKKDRDSFVNNLQQQIVNLNNQVAEYNSKLELAVKEAIKKGKEKNANQTDLLAELGNKIKGNDE